MSNSRPLAEHSRKELYDLIWSTPAVTLAASFGISSVAVAKRCKRLNIPRPSRGCWAKIEGGKAPKKVPLPPQVDEVFVQACRHRVPKALPLPNDTEPMLPLAAELMKSIAKADLDSCKRASLKKGEFPEVLVSKALAERVAQAFH